MVVFLQAVSRASMSDDILALANFYLAIRIGRMATELQVNRKFSLIFFFYSFLPFPCLLLVSESTALVLCTMYSRKVNQTEH